MDIRSVDLLGGKGKKRREKKLFDEEYWFSVKCGALQEHAAPIALQLQRPSKGANHQELNVVAFSSGKSGMTKRVLATGRDMARLEEIASKYRAKTPGRLIVICPKAITNAGKKSRTKRASRTR